MNDFVFRACTGFDLGVNHSQPPEEGRVIDEEQARPRTDSVIFGPSVIRIIILGLCIVALNSGIRSADHGYTIWVGNTAEQFFVALLEGATWLFATLSLGTWLIVELAHVRAWFRKRSMAARRRPAAG